MRFLIYIFCALLFVTASVAETININWMNGNTTYAQTTCEIGGDLILPESPTKRGYTFKGWVARYTRLEYIESTGTQYIDTGISPHTSGKIDIKMSPIVLSSNYLCGARVDNKLYSGIMGSSTGYTIISSMVKTSTQSSGVTSNIIRKARNVYHIVTEAEYNSTEGYRTKLFVENTTDKTSDTVYSNYFKDTLVTTQQNMLLFAVNKDDRIKRTRVYYYKYWDNDRNLIINYIPAKRDSDGAVGMYDTVSGKFFTNAGTGEFIAGPAAENQNFL